MRHVVWDWNGTLFDDQHLVVAALNAVMPAGSDPVTLERYRALYCRPVQVFYEKLYGRPIPDEEWEELDHLYHETYAQLLHDAGLAADALHALEHVERSGRTQSLLSMYRHDDLVPLIRRFRLDQRFVRVDGLRGPGGGRKAAYLEAHLSELVHHTPLGPRDILVVGDAVDDAEAARHVGARCVLYDGGSHPLEALERTGAPVAATLLEALAIAGID